MSKTVGLTIDRNVVPLTVGEVESPMKYDFKGTAVEGVPGDYINCVPTVVATSCKSNDPVNHPAHYTAHPSGIECIEVTRHFNFNLGNAIKYIWRNGLKSKTPVEDLKKAIWYLTDELKRLEK